MVITIDLDYPRNQDYDVRHPERLKAFADAGVENIVPTADETRLQMFFDEIRSNDFHYRYTRVLEKLIKYLHEDGKEYLIKHERLFGVSPIGNQKSYTWQLGLVTIPEPVYTSVPVNSESYKQEVIEMRKGKEKYEIEFNEKNVKEALKASPYYPENETRGVGLKIHAYNENHPYEIKNFKTWLKYDTELLFKACKSGRIDLLGNEENHIDMIAGLLVSLSDEERTKAMKIAEEQQRKEEMKKAATINTKR